MKTYLFIYSGSLLLAMIFTPIVIFVAGALNIYDDIHARKIHASAVPRLGGVAIFLSMMLVTVPTLLLDNPIGESFRQIGIQPIVLLMAGGFMFAIGFIDDLCGVRARYKLIAQLIAAVAMCIIGVRIDSVSVEGLFSIQLGWLAWPITILWIAGVTNAVNFIDGLDGLAGGIAAIVCGVIAAFSIYTGQTVMAVLMLALLGSLTGFLLFNFNPAKVFMGDCGSLFLGFIIGSASVMCASKSATIVGLALPFLALGVPLFDMVFSMLRRILERRSMFSPDRGH
ncbi:MAG: undecaprenyl/decaprenyl-phosphate alpha-N-acetylglucosaminyl 1-phosphate transferase, partial [Sedimentisphaerales bacterium]|nr:undecaprenyl/decaprenyl-phosphate alpha-N-acetylglucosaminyl 1-phosphate transferase [Sedimentisphaerales bacterium]